ncbi:unnamed protein product [Coffea canephora]|uniref:RBR-type E3 ubiquitin transferase n=1 Tax=Coffea canephora TaxID=49390 RepID=A0A068TNL2_COFCA|nr:unnamed protein product [Coffea canephora]
MARRKKSKSLRPVNSDMEVDNNERENKEHGWSWEKEFQSKEEEDYFSISFFDDHDDGQYSWHTGGGHRYYRQKAISYSRITMLREHEIDDDDDDASPKAPDVKQKGICNSYPLKLKPRFSAPFNIWTSRTEKGESSWSECALCGDDKPTGEMQRSSDCGHLFCEDCMRVYVGGKIQEYTNINKKIKCPKENCNKQLGIQQFRQYIPDEVYDRIVEARRESNVLASPEIMKCPLLFCSAKFVDDNRGFKIKACPGCWGIFCVECGVKWHMGKSCEEYQAEVRADAIAQARAGFDAVAHDLMQYSSLIREHLSLPAIFFFR